ncbi:MAG: Nif3-like dinuclear metal center hexameric protein [Candidatus Cloacimonetes bacterium]|nr:Nif3-like dinuclear metal center hexameric protein [Candidatus Cloacimonadota bacterium]HOH60090.1 Nif3-like dinuclear metal center hexameric protein [Candidatus Cloacimonadota bacterium]HPI25763.1 Nif3-like dinuclear metal center hexameric protein [Candidatus Cloacimonadota bacterium]
MTIGSILEHLEQYAPRSLAQSWDNVGLLIGDPKRKLGKVLISLDATANTLGYAIENDFDLILTHHPLIFRPLSRITNPLILGMIEAKISLISMHTNFDAALGGVNHALADTLGMEVIDSLGDPEAGDIGLVCSYPAPITIGEIAGIVKTALQAPTIKMWTAGMPDDTKISRIAICGGAGGSVLDSASAKADLLITGDVTYHTFLDSKIPIIDAGHFATEYPALKALQDSLSSIGISSEILDINLHEWILNIRYL